MIYILIHKPSKKESKVISDWLYETLDRCYPGKINSYHDGSVLCVDNRFELDIRCGLDPSKFPGIRSDYYYTESDGLIAEVLEQGACKVNGRRLRDVGDVFLVISGFMAMFAQIDKLLEESEE